MIPPLLGFYAKLFVLHSLSVANISIAILAIICSVISCLRYLNIIQISNKKKENVINKLKINLEINNYRASIIAIFTVFLTLSFLSPIYLISTKSKLKI